MQTSRWALISFVAALLLGHDPHRADDGALGSDHRTSHRPTVVSAEAEANVPPSGEKATS